MSTNETKSLFQSKTIIGIVIAALPTLLGLFGYQVSDVTAFAAGSEDAINSLVTLAGSAVAVWGRVTATSKLVIKK